MRELLEAVNMEKGAKFWKAMVGTVVTALTIIGGVIAILTYRQGYSRYDLGGEWRITNTIESTKYRPFQGLKLGYRIFLTQHGRDISGTGEKVSENGKELPSGAHTPIQLTASISGNKIAATFEEAGTGRKSSGTFEWKYEAETNSLTGTFTSTAATSSGSSVGARAPH